MLHHVPRGLIIALLIAGFAFSGKGQDSATPMNASPVTGTWSGESICVGDRPACKNEIVVYRFEPVAGKSTVITLLADKIIEGKRVPMGKLDFQYDEAKRTLSCEFTRGQTHGMWEFKITGDTMEGTGIVLPDKSLVRRVKVKQVTED